MLKCIFSMHKKYKSWFLIPFFKFGWQFSIHILRIILAHTQNFYEIYEKRK